MAEEQRLAEEPRRRAATGRATANVAAPRELARAAHHAATAVRQPWANFPSVMGWHRFRTRIAVVHGSVTQEEQSKYCQDYTRAARRQLLARAPRVGRRQEGRPRRHRRQEGRKRRREARRRRRARRQAEGPAPAHGCRGQGRVPQGVSARPAPCIHQRDDERENAPFNSARPGCAGSRWLGCRGVVCSANTAFLRGEKGEVISHCHRWQKCSTLCSHDVSTAWEDESLIASTRCSNQDCVVGALD